MCTCHDESNLQQFAKHYKSSSESPFSTRKPFSLNIRPLFLGHVEIVFCLQEKKPGEVLYADLADFPMPEMPKQPTSKTLPPLKRAPCYETTDYAEITEFLKKEAALPPNKSNRGSKRQPPGVNQSENKVINKETTL